MISYFSFGAFYGNDSVRNAMEGGCKTVIP